MVAEHGVPPRRDDRPLMGILEINQFLSMVRDGDMVHAPHAAYLINNGRHFVVIVRLGAVPEERRPLLLE
eukprot:9446-Eustigmatos_ZCMA.PRE.1